jgi:hypothetical protein
MPVNILIGVLSLFGALVLYTVGVWGAFRSKAVGSRHVVLLWIGLVFDVLATSMMALQIGGFGRDLHTALALLGMFGMFLAAAVGSWALAAGHDAARRFVARWTVAPWALWVFVFVWGMVSRGAARLH